MNADFAFYLCYHVPKKAHISSFLPFISVTTCRIQSPFHYINHVPKKAHISSFLPCQYPAERALVALAMFVNIWLFLAEEGSQVDKLLVKFLCLQVLNVLKYPMNAIFTLSIPSRTRSFGLSYVYGCCLCEQRKGHKSVFVS